MFTTTILAAAFALDITASQFTFQQPSYSLPALQEIAVSRETNAIYGRISHDQSEKIRGVRLSQSLGGVCEETLDPPPANAVWVRADRFAEELLADFPPAHQQIIFGWLLFGCPN